MPYIGQHQRVLVDSGVQPRTCGELNYVITKAIKTFLGGSLSYGDINDVIGVLECAKLELYRRIAAPYEDKKCAENGDVYTT